MRNGCKKILKSRQGSTQGRLDTFFTVTGSLSSKRKVCVTSRRDSGHQITTRSSVNAKWWHFKVLTSYHENTDSKWEVLFSTRQLWASADDGLFMTYCHPFVDRSHSWRVQPRRNRRRARRLASLKRANERVKQSRSGWIMESMEKVLNVQWHTALYFIPFFFLMQI